MTVDISQNAVEAIVAGGGSHVGQYSAELLVNGPGAHVGQYGVELIVSVPIDPLVLIPSFPVEIETRKQVLISQSDRGVRQSVAKSRAFRFYTLEFKDRQKAEYESFELEWAGFYPDVTFTWSHAVLDASGEFYFDSPVRWAPRLNNLVDYSVVVKRKNPIATGLPASNALPVTPSYRYEGNPSKEVLVSDAIDYSREAAALGAQRRLFTLGFRARSLAEVLEMEQFWDYHYPGRPIAFTDPVLNISGDFWIDSNFRWRVLANNLVEYSFAIREV